MAPEILGRDEQNEKVDVWCLGVLLYELLHKKTPYMGLNMIAMQYLQKNREIEFNPDINPDLRAIIEQCLSLRPEERPNTEEILSRAVFNRCKSSSTADSRDKEKKVKSMRESFCSLDKETADKKVPLQDNPRPKIGCYKSELALKHQTTPSLSDDMLFCNFQTRIVTPLKDNRQCTKNTTAGEKSMPHRTKYAKNFERKTVEGLDLSAIPQQKETVKRSPSRLNSSDKHIDKNEPLPLTSTTGNPFKQANSTSSRTIVAGPNPIAEETRAPHQNIYKQFASPYTKLSKRMITFNGGMVSDQHTSLIKTNLYKSNVPTAETRPTALRYIHTPQTRSSVDMSFGPEHGHAIYNLSPTKDTGESNCYDQLPFNRSDGESKHESVGSRPMSTKTITLNHGKPSIVANRREPCMYSNFVTLHRSTRHANDAKISSMTRRVIYTN